MTVVLPVVICVLVAANVLNNWLAPSAYLVTCVVTAGILLVLLRSAGESWATAGLGRDAAGRGLAWGLVLAFVVGLAYLLLALHPATRVLFEDRRTLDTSIAYQALVRVPLGTVLLEEVAFRGVLYGLVREQYGTVWATAVSSFLFGLWHILPSWNLGDANAALGRFGPVLVTAAAVVGTALAGVALCELRRISGSLLAPAFLHWATNGLGYLIASTVTRSHLE